MPAWHPTQKFDFFPLVLVQTEGTLVARNHLVDVPVLYTLHVYHVVFGLFLAQRNRVFALRFFILLLFKLGSAQAGARIYIDDLQEAFIRSQVQFASQLILIRVYNHVVLHHSSVYVGQLTAEEGKYFDILAGLHNYYIAETIVESINGPWVVNLGQGFLLFVLEETQVVEGLEAEPISPKHGLINGQQAVIQVELHFVRIVNLLKCEQIPYIPHNNQMPFIHCYYKGLLAYHCHISDGMGVTLQVAQEALAEVVAGRPDLCCKVKRARNQISAVPRHVDAPLYARAVGIVYDAERLPSLQTVQH
jgi:hypothetical protein